MPCSPGHLNQRTPRAQPYRRRARLSVVRRLSVLNGEPTVPGMDAGQMESVPAELRALSRERMAELVSTRPGRTAKASEMVARRGHANLLLMPAGIVCATCLHSCVVSVASVAGAQRKEVPAMLMETIEQTPAITVQNGWGQSSVSVAISRMSR